MNIRHLWLNQRTNITVAMASALYLIATALLFGLRVEHWLIIGIYNLCFFYGSKTRKFILAFTVFLVFAMVYDLMKAFPNYLVNPVDTSSLYHFEQKIFGFMSNGVMLTPNEFFALHHNRFLDLMSGLFYINWMPVPLAFGVWLYFNNKKQFLNFSVAFLFVNLIGFCLYYIHPAAPPWYIAKYGFDVHLNTAGETAGLGRFDALVGIKLFGSLYARNSNVFAAIPSLHCAYPVVVLYYALKANVRWMKWLFVLFMLGIWFSAVYSGHHYITDAILGILCAIIGIGLFEGLLLKIKFVNRFMTNYEANII